MDQHNYVAAAAVLDLAADLMEEHGHLRGLYWANGGPWMGGPMCTEGAVIVAHQQVYSDVILTPSHRVFVLAMSQLEAQLPSWPTATGKSKVPWWNDEHCSSKEEAVQLLRDTAIKTRPDAYRVVA